VADLNHRIMAADRSGCAREPDAGARETVCGSSETHHAHRDPFSVAGGPPILASSSNGTVELLLVFAFAVATNALVYGICALVMVCVCRSITNQSPNEEVSSLSALSRAKD
jgi:hypothetical protein